MVSTTQACRRLGAIAALVLVLFARAGASGAEPPRSLADEPASDVREVLRLSGIDDARWEQLADQSWGEAQQETLQQILLRMSGLPADEIQRQAVTPLDAKRLTADPKAFEGKVFSLRGQVRSVKVLRLSGDLAQRYRTNRFYRVAMTVADGKLPVVVFTRTVPETWRRGGDVNRPGGAFALFLALRRGSSGAMPVFAAARVASYDKDRLLGQLGMDLGLLDDVVDRRPIRPEERECFYQMLAAVNRAKPGQILKTARRELRRQGKTHFSVEPLFNDPAAQRGKLVVLSGHVRRAIRVRVDDPDIRRRFGIDHYYELYLYTDDSQGNPLVFCVRELPKDMPTGEGPDYLEPVTVAGFFLKSWAYPSEATAVQERGKEGETPSLQLAPLLIGRHPILRHPDEVTSSPIWGAVCGGCFVLLLLGVWLWLWRRSKNDRRFERDTLKRIRAGNDADSETQPGEDTPIQLDLPDSK